jgi:hypothetical protein
MPRQSRIAISPVRPEVIRPCRHEIQPFFQNDTGVVQEDKRVSRPRVFPVQGKCLEFSFMAESSMIHEP